MRFLFLLLIFFSLPVYAADWEHVGSRGMMEFVVVAKENIAEKKIYLDAIDSICAPNQFCHVMFWAKKDLVPTSWPMTEEQIQAMTLEYFYHANEEETIFTWNCDVIDDESCVTTHE